MTENSTTTTNSSTTFCFETIQVKTEIKSEPDDDLLIVYDSLASNSQTSPATDLPSPSKVDIICKEEDGIQERPQSPKEQQIEPEASLSAAVKCEQNEDQSTVNQENQPVESNIDNQSIDDGVYYECDICLMKFSSKFTLSTHREVHHNTSKFKCEYCKMTFQSSRKYIDHRLSHFTMLNGSKGANTPHMYPNASLQKWLVSYDEEFECDICFLKFEGVEVLASHKLTHMPHLSYKCRLCGIKFTTEQFLDQHTEKMHKSGRFTCPVCKMQFFLKKHLRRHMVYHSSKRYFQCATCLHLFKKKADIIEHVKIHMK